MADRRPHGSFLAGEAGELAGVSGTTLGQWARRGLIRSSVSDGEPRRYAVEDVAEAAVVRALLARGVRHADVHGAIARLGRR
ncbi:MAG: helix-turn-helix domain-containing protein, partial [Actinomycetota bacterium]|nr:helix-turn-helix domain-containing protein [Actinomycetota bacterium]